jgi:hypothetical protein
MDRIFKHIFISVVYFLPSRSQIAASVKARTRTHTHPHTHTHTHTFSNHVSQKHVVIFVESTGINTLNYKKYYTKHLIVLK